MKLKQIQKKRLITKALEDGIKKAVELILIGLIVGVSLKLLLLTVFGVVGGSVYCQDSQITRLRIRAKPQPKRGGE